MLSSTVWRAPGGGIAPAEPSALLLLGQGRAEGRLGDVAEAPRGWALAAPLPASVLRVAAGRVGAKTRESSSLSPPAVMSGRAKRALDECSDACVRARAWAHEVGQGGTRSVQAMDAISS